MLIRSVVVGGRELAAGTEVWRHASGEIEHRGKMARVPPDALVDAPVRAPSLDALHALDGCFGLGDDAFDIEHEDSRNHFSIVRCKAHRRRFLRDLRGGVGMYESMTLLEDTENESSPEDVWRRYHAMPIEWLFYLGRTG
jgi:hypothetical protein